MNEKTCPKCSKEIPGEAVFCKHCGANLKNKNWFKKHPVLSVLLLLFGIPMLIGFISAATNNTTSTVSNNNAVTAKNEPVAEPVKEKVIFPVEIISEKIANDSIGTPILKVTVKNTSKKTIDAMTIMTSFLNNYDEPVGKFGARDKDYFAGLIQEKIAPGSTYSSEWNLAVYETATKATGTEIYKVHFTDGTTLSQE